jgi:hypothetical protein
VAPPLLTGWFDVFVLDSDLDIVILFRLKQYLSVMYM